MNNRKLNFYAFPYMIWMSLFFVIPTLMVILVSTIDQVSWDALVTAIRNFHPMVREDGISTALRTTGQSLSLKFSLGAYKELFEPRVTITLMRTLRISVIAAVVCVVLSIPSAHFISRSSHKNTLLMLLIVPFWTNFLIRIFTWIKILGNNGIINQFFLSTGFITTPLPLMYNNFAITVMSIYTCLPFAIIPIFSAIEKFDFSLWEVSEDLGAKTWQSLLYVYFPGIKNGIASALVFSFINTFGNYAVAKLVGGRSSYMLGSLVVHNATVGRNMPLAAAISTMICFLALVLMLLTSPRPQQGQRL